MKKLIIFSTIISFFISLSCHSKSTDKKAAITKRDTIQHAVVAGQFYPSSPDDLRAMINNFLSAAKIEKIERNLMGIVVPHAGYQYSGPVAAYGFKALEGNKYDYAVVIAPSHHKQISGAATRLAEYYKTPLGNIPIATEIASRMVMKYDWIVDDADAFSREHALDVELPFLQSVTTGFKLIPLIVGTHDPDTLANIAGSLNEELIGKNVIYVVSTDLSHYHPYDKASKMDKHTLDLITSGKFTEFQKSVADGQCELCGFGPLMIMLNLYSMRGGGETELLKYANSGDTAGEKGRVVGYASLAIFNKFQLNENEKSELLRLSRTTLVDHVENKNIKPASSKDPYLMQPGAPFVTLRENKNLRGCIGHIIAHKPLIKAVQENTISAASHDPRFQPVQEKELKDISIEISVLTPPQPVYDPDTIVLGRDGLIIRKGSYSGVLLPQVPGEAGWDLDQYLRGICRKAGLPPDAINDPDTKLFRFQALVFGEDEKH